MSTAMRKAITCVTLGACVLMTWLPLNAGSNGTQSIADRHVEWPRWEQVRRLLVMEDYNTRVVILGVAILGAATGLVGSFTLLRKRALMSDALAHASLPGIALAFMIATQLGVSGKSMPLLLLGGTVSGLVGVGLILTIQYMTRIKQDAALGIILSVFFGIGTALLGLCQQFGAGNAAGLESFIYGKSASMSSADVKLISVAAFVGMLGCVLLFKEFKQLCFDEAFARSTGVPTVFLDVVMMMFVVLVTMVGLQAVGLVLVVALLVIPPASARFWTEKMWPMAAIASLVGMLSGIVGAGLSDLFPRLPSGAMIVLVCSLLFGISFVFGTARGVVVRMVRRRWLNMRIERQHLLRGAYELIESRTAADHISGERNVSLNALLDLRSWTRKQLLAGIRRAERDEQLRLHGDSVYLTQAGIAEAARLTRQHRLWELYLIHHADVAPGRVDRDADDIEHVLEPELVDELEVLLNQSAIRIAVPHNPHRDEVVPR
ncbi:MAG: metal ABC transporter permease [Pirellula sp.]